MRKGVILFSSWAAALAVHAGKPLSSNVSPMPALRLGAAFVSPAQTPEGATLSSSSNLLDWTAGPLVWPDAPGPYDLTRYAGLLCLRSPTKGWAVSFAPDAPFVPAGKWTLPGDRPRLFQTPSGKGLVFFHRTAPKSKRGIWAQPIAAPWKAPSGRPQPMAMPRLGTWDAIDAEDLDQPEILFHRGQYHLLFTANQPGPRTGRRAIGIAETNDLRRLAKTKRPAPLLEGNSARLASEYETLLPSGEFAPWKGRYVYRKTEGNWTRPDFVPKGWRSGIGGFGFPNEERGVRIQACRTEWKPAEKTIRIRRRFDLPDGRPPQTPVLKIRHEGAARVFLNGTPVYAASNDCPAYAHVDLSDRPLSFRAKRNVLCAQVVANPKNPFRFFDFGLFDAGDRPVEPIVVAPDAPRVVEGPNGFEYRLLYRAWVNGRNRPLADRLFFFGDRMTTDGPTPAAAPGFHPPPAPPSFADDFSRERPDAWQAVGTPWTFENATARPPTGRKPALLLLRRKPAAHYLFEADVLLPPDAKKGSVGFVVCHTPTNDLFLSIDPAKRTWSLFDRRTARRPDTRPLPSALLRNLAPKPLAQSNRPRPHRLRVEKNAESIRVRLDGVELSSRKIRLRSFAGPGIPGLYARNAKTAFDDVVFTRGWSEFGADDPSGKERKPILRANGVSLSIGRIRRANVETEFAGWGHAGSVKATGEWRIDESLGLRQRRALVRARIFKGDLLRAYEFTTLVRPKDLRGGAGRRYGVLPVFADPENYLEAVIDADRRTLRLSGKLNGKAIGPLEKSLFRRIRVHALYDPMIDYRYLATWLYPLPSESIVSGMDVRWMNGEYDLLGQAFRPPDDDLHVRYTTDYNPVEGTTVIDNPTFYCAEIPAPETQLPNHSNPIDLRPFPASHVALSIQSGGPSGEESSDEARPRETLIRVELESAYFFRCIKLADRVIIELNGRPMLEIEGAWPPSRVGLITVGQPASYAGTTLFELPADWPNTGDPTP